MSERPLVSVVMPVHDGEAFVAEAVASVLAQTWRPLELVVVDDGSGEATRRALERLLAPEVRVLRTEHGGVGRARNLGIAAARGPVLAFLDHDDAWTPTHLERAVPRLLEREGRFVYEDVAWQGEVPPGPPTFPPADHVPARTYAEAWRRLFVVSPGQVVVRRADVLAAGGFPEERDVSGADDRGLWLRLVRRGVLPEPTRAVGLLYRLHAGQASRRRVAQKRARLVLQERTALETAGDPPRPLVPPEVAAPYLAELGLDLAHDLLDEDPAAADREAARALERHPPLAADPRWAAYRRKRRRKALARIPLLGPLARAFRRLRRGREGPAGILRG